MLYFIYFGLTLKIFNNNSGKDKEIILPVLISSIIFSIIPMYYYKARYQAVMLPLLAPYFIKFIDIVTRFTNKHIGGKRYNYVHKET